MALEDTRMSYETLSSKYHVETDAADWPSGLPKDQREPLIVLVKEALARWGAKGAPLYDVERMVSAAADRTGTVPIFKTASLWDFRYAYFRYACIERALRACDAEQRWHAKEAT